MIKILFVCHGNICRSPMAEFVMRDLVQKAGLAGRIEAASAATSSEELGEPVYPPVRALLKRHGLDTAGKTARRVTMQDFADFDLLIGMDEENRRNLLRLAGEEYAHKVHLLLDYTDSPGPVADPWYTRNFEAAWLDVSRGCQGLLASLQERLPQ